MRREDFEREALLRGMNRATFYMYLDNSPIIACFARGVYGLPGTILPPGLVESLKPRVRRSRVLKDFGWNKSGCIWVEYILSPQAISSGLVTLPASLSEYVNPPYQILGSNREMISFGATLSVGGLLMDREAQAGTSMIIVFDEKHKTAAIHLGDVDSIAAFK